MSKKLKRKAAILFVTEAICIFVLGLFLVNLQTSISVNNQDNDIREKVTQMQELIDQADETASQNEASYDEVYQSKAASVAYMANWTKDFEQTNDNMSALAEKMNVTNVLLVDKAGNVIASGMKSDADFTKHRFDQLRTVFDTEEPSQAFEVTYGEDTVRRYYGAKIDDNTEAVIEHDPQELTDLTKSTSSWKSILSKVSVGLKGYAFAVSSQDYTFLYHPNSDLIGQDALAAGMNVKNLEDGHFGWMIVNGERHYCGVTKIDADNAYVICAVPETEIIESRNLTVGIVLFIFFIVVTVVIVYVILMLADKERNHVEEDSENDRHFGIFHYDKTIARRAGAISMIGVLAILVVSFYMQNLFSISNHSMSISQRVNELEEDITNSNDEVDLITQQYNRRYLNKCQIAAYILEGRDYLWEKDALQALNTALGTKNLFIFDKNGKEVLSSSTYVGIEISDDPDTQTYEFNQLLTGEEYLVQEAQENDTSKTYTQYIGVILKDMEGNADGFVQIEVSPEKLQQTIATATVTSILHGVKVGTNGFAFGVSKADQTFSYFPEDKLVGKAAADYGMTEEQFRDGYNDYITVNGTKYYGECLEGKNNFVYVVIPQEEMTSNSLPVALATAGVSILCILLILLILMAEGKEKAVLDEATGEPIEEAAEEVEGQSANGNALIDVQMPDGSTRKTDSAASRWSNLSIGWGEKTPEQKVSSILKWMLSILAIFICAMVLFKDKVLADNSIFKYVIQGRWQRGMNIFAITGCIMIICVASVLTMVIREILRVMARTFGARGETICRMLSSFLKYFAVIAVLYYCFALFGVDTQTLLASAGILTLVIGLGAKTLVSDILAGLFIIFEGDFRVGDIVTIGDWRGTVVEIGIRTTKIESPGSDVKIISNSAVSGVINMTKRNSFAACDIGIEYGESLERVENVLEKEFPIIREHVPAIKDGPFYKGVTSLGDNSVNIKIVAKCAEGDRAQVCRDLNREMKLIFDKHDINIPFPQVVINEPKEYQKATAWEKYRAEKFNEEQKAAGKDLKESQGDQN